MDKKIDIENLLYYKYLIDLKFDNIKQNKFDENLNKKVDNFYYLINKSIDNSLPSQIDKFNKIYIVLKEYNNKCKTFNIKQKDNDEYMKDYINAINKINITITEIIDTNLPKQKQLQHAQHLYKDIYKQQQQQQQRQQQQQQQQQRQRQQQRQQQQQRQPNLVLINAVGDGECFINAIFDYGLYTNKIDKIYEKLIYIENYITSNVLKLKNNYYVFQLINNFSKYERTNAELFRQYNVLNHNTYNIYNIIDKSLFLEKPIPDKYTNKINIQKYYTHKYYAVNDPNGRTQFYELNRKYFINYMKYIWALYSLTINFKSFREGLKNHYFHEEFNQETLNELPKELVDFITEKYYIGNILKENTNFDELTIQYIWKFYIGDNIYLSKMEISRFQEMFKEPITDSNYIPEEYEDHIVDNSFQGDKFFISEKKLINIMNGDDYKKKYKKDKNEHNITVIHENDDHFLLCLYEDEMSYDFDDQGNIMMLL